MQTLQQLKDVYGDSVDKVVQGNVSNIIFLKSTDETMLETLQKMSGITHRVYRNSKTVTRREGKFLNKNEDTISVTLASQEEAVITYNDMAFINDRNSMVFRAGKSPIWNRNETILPMSWKLYDNTISQPGKAYTLQTIPTLSSAVDFDLRGNQPDFEKMLDKRIEQAVYAPVAKELFQKSYGYTDHDIALLDTEAYSKEIMEMINDMIAQDLAKQRALEAAKSGGVAEQGDDILLDDVNFGNLAGAVKDENVVKQTEKILAAKTERERGVFAKGLLSREALVRRLYDEYDDYSKAVPNHKYDRYFIEAFRELKNEMFKDKKYFSEMNGNLMSADCKTIYIQKLDEGEALQEMKIINEATMQADKRVFAAHDARGEVADGSIGSISEEQFDGLVMWSVSDAFIEFLEGLPSWSFANGRFDNLVARLLSSN